MKKYDDREIAIAPPMLNHLLIPKAFNKTKNATKILRNGDSVEVDAENGVVKIIKN